jgi:AcrR family transcriptional regulator
MPMYAKSAVTIANILESAQGLFITKNYADVTMSDIAFAADVTKGALYHHFSSKEDLYLKMMHGYLAEIAAMASSVVQSTEGWPCRDRLRQVTVSFLKLPEIQKELMRLVRRDINILKNPERELLIRDYQASLPEPVEAIIRAGIVNGEIDGTDARLLSWEHVAVVEVVLRPYAQSVLGDAEDIADFVIGLFFDGAAKRSS